jgi:hypothetical protein
MHAQDIWIDSPRSGEILQGMVWISGNTDSENFDQYDISFSYDTDLNPTWFLIHTSAQPVHNGLLATWDTTTIADGTYRLRIRVYKNDSSFLDIFIEGLQVRNYSPEEVPLISNNLPIIANSKTTEPIAPAPQLTGTPLANNSAIISDVMFLNRLLSGVILVSALFLIFGIYRTIKSRASR